MGCASSKSAAAQALEAATRSKVLALQVGELDKNDSLDVRTLTMLMWRARDSPELLEVLSDLVATQSDEREVFEGVEFYLPQLAHMVIHLEANITTSTLEAFALLVSQLSLHFALQLYWILVAAMEDYQPELSDGRRNPTAHPELYIRCATLLHKVEQSVVFGSPRCPEFEALFAQGQLTRDELHEIELADRRFMAAQIAEAEVHEEAMVGWLGYKRWNTTGMFQRKKWKQRYFKVIHRVLLCYSSSDGALRRAIPLQHTTVTVKEHRVHKYYFELAEAKRERVYKLTAKTGAEMNEWVRILRQEAAAPPSYAPTDFDTTTLSPAQIGRYGFFRSEREFVRTLTDICEELRFVEVGKRKPELEQRLSQLTIPGCVYLPLTKSTDVWHRVVGVQEKEGIPFSTRERCPCLLTFEVATEGPSGIDVANYLYQTLGLGASLISEAEVDASDVSPEFLLEDTPADVEGTAELDQMGSTSPDLRSWREKFVNSARQSVSAFNLSSISLGSSASPTNVTHTEEENENVESNQEPAHPSILPGARGRRLGRNIGASTRKLVESAKGAAGRAKKGASQAVGKVRTAVGNVGERSEGTPSIWTKRTPRGSITGSFSTTNGEQGTNQSQGQQQTTKVTLFHRKQERRSQNKRRAIQLINSRSKSPSPDNLVDDQTGSNSSDDSVIQNATSTSVSNPQENHVGSDNNRVADVSNVNNAEDHVTDNPKPMPVRREGSSLGERPFLRSLGRIAAKPLQVKKLAARLKEGGQRYGRSGSNDVIEAAADAASEPPTELKNRIRTESNIAMSIEGWDISRVIAKSNDDLRQEVFVMQLIQFINDIWIDAGLTLHLHPYRILSTSKECGILEVVGNANSLDGVKKGLKNDDGTYRRLIQYFEGEHGTGTPEFVDAQRNFAVSMAGYSVVCYLLGIKDRHNGNIMVHKDGFITHIDFGFVFGMAPGKNKVPHTNFSMERAPFKLTNEMVEVMGGLGSPLWDEFETMFVDGLLACRKHEETILTLVEIMGYKSNYPCFNQPGGTAVVLKQLKSNLMLNASEETVRKRARKLVRQSVHHWGTVLYEKFQKYSNGINPIF